MRHSIFLAALFAVMASCASAQSIEIACLRSDRQAKSRALCGCIQQAADLVLSKADQKLAAKFYADPHMAQSIRQSKRRSDSLFWDRYKQYASTASQYCK